MATNLVISLDVEKDLHQDSFLSVTEGLKKFEKICPSHVKPILFVTGEVIEK